MPYYIPKNLRTPELEKLNQEKNLTVCNCCGSRDKLIEIGEYATIYKTCKSKTYIGKSRGGHTYCVARKDGKAIKEKS